MSRIYETNGNEKNKGYTTLLTRFYHDGEQDVFHETEEERELVALAIV